MTLSDYRRIVENIQIVLSQPAVPLDAIHKMSVEYIAACDEINARLRSCHDLLRRGLRSQAVQECEVEPKLLDVVATLDFPELQNWINVLAANNLVLPPPLLIETAAELNEAFAQERPLASLMRMHRKLALARAPLRSRLTVLRKIATVDANQAVWDEDVRDWERARQLEIGREAETALSRRNVEWLEELDKELHNAEWRETPENGLVQKISSMATQLRVRHSRAELQRLVPEITAAYQEFDVALGRELRSQWVAHAAGARLQQHDELAVAAEPTLAWLEQEDRKDSLRLEVEAAEARLTQALDEDLPAVELDRRYNDLMRLEQGINDQLAGRFMGRMEEHRLAQLRKHRLILTGVVAAILVACGLTSFFVIRHQRGTEVDGYVAVLEGLLDADKLTDALPIIQGLSDKPDYIRQDPRILELLAKYNGMVQAEHDRKAAFQASLAEIERRAAGATEVSTLEAGRKSLQELKLKAQSVDEEVEVARVDGNFAGRIREIEAARATAYGQKIDDLREKVGRVKAGELLGYADRGQAAKELLNETNRLAREGTGLPQALTSGVAVLEAQLQGIVEVEKTAAVERSSLHRINEAVGSPQQFRDALSIYVKVFEKSSRSQDFLKVLEKEPDFWGRVATWNAFVTKHAKMDVTKMPSGQASSLAAEIKSFLNDHGSFPGAEVLRSKVGYLDSIALRDGQNGSLKDALNAPFRDYTIADLYFVREAEGAKQYNYYSPEPLKMPAAELSALIFNYIIDADRTVPLKSKVLKQSQVVMRKDDRQVEVPVIGRAPQSEFAEESQRKLRLMRPGEWELTFERIVFDLRDNEYMDPIVKVQLLTFVLGVGGQGSSVMQTELKPYLDQLQSIAAEVAVNWIDPHNPSVVTARKSAESVLKDVLPGLEKAFDDVKEDLANLAKSPELPTYEWIGWLQLSTADQWICPTRGLPSDFNAELFVLTPTDPEGVGFAAVGKVQNGMVQLLPATQAFLQGRPVFAMKSVVP